MAPEYGATTGFFPVDANTLAYLRDTGRERRRGGAGRGLHAAATASGSIPAATPRYSRSIEIDLADDRHARRRAAAAAGPARAMPRCRPCCAAGTLRTADATRRPAAPSGRGGRDHELHQHLGPGAPDRRRPGGAQGARARPAPPAWVKTSLAPGSPAAALLPAALRPARGPRRRWASASSASAAAPASATPARSPSRSAKRSAKAAAKAVAMLSGNRNFPGRVHPDLELGFIMSPPLVVAFGLAGDAERDLSREPVQTGGDGAPVYLRDLWPTKEEVETHLARSRDPPTTRATSPIGEPQSALATPSRRRPRRSSPWDPRIDRSCAGRRSPRPTKAASSAATAPGRCWSSATTSPPTTSRRRARSRPTAVSPTSWSSAASSATTSTSSPPGAATGR